MRVRVEPGMRRAGVGTRSRWLCVWMAAGVAACVTGEERFPGAEISAELANGQGTGRGEIMLPGRRAAAHAAGYGAGFSVVKGPRQDAPDDGARGADGGMWRFRGAAGQTVVVTAGSGAFDTSVAVLAAAGDELAWDDDSGAGTDSRLLVTLPRDGEYEVWVASPFDRESGIYYVAVRDAVVNALEVGVPVDGVLGVDDGVWRFGGAAGQTVVVTAGSDALDTLVELRGPEGMLFGGDDDGGPDTDSRLVATLPRDGRYEVRVKPSFGDVAGPYRTGVRDAVVAPLVLDLPIEGRLGVDDGVWRFRGEGGQRVVATAGSDAFDTFLELRAVAGGVIERDDDGGPGTDSRFAAMLPDDGEYEVRVGPAVGDAVGPYNLAVHRVISPSMEGETRVDGDLRVDSGGWRFQGEAGRLVAVTAGSEAFDTVVDLFSPQGERLQRDEDDGPGTDSRLVAKLPRTGEYEIRVMTSDGGTGPYDVAVRDVAFLERGAPKWGVLGVDGGVWRFRGEAGERVVVEVDSDAFATAFGLLSSEGERVGSDGGPGGESRLVATLPREGEYEIRVRAWDGGSGSYEVLVRNPVVRSLEGDEPVEGFMGSEYVVWRFRGEAGRTVVVTAGSDAFDADVELSSREGERLGSDYDSGDALLVATLPRDGEYEVTVTSFDGGATGSYYVGVRDAVVASLELNARVDGRFGVDDGVWRFRGEAGRRVVVTTGSDVFDTLVQLRASDGRRLDGDDDSGPGTDSRLMATLPSDGEYQVWVRPFGGGPRSYYVGVSDVVAAPLEVDVPVEGVLGVDDGAWRFRGVAGQSVVVTTDSDAFNTSVELLSPEGEALRRDMVDGPGNDDRMVATLPSDGEYEVLVRSVNVDGGGPYEVAVRNVAVAPLRRDAPVDGLLDVDGGRWRFRGAAGQRVVVTAGSDAFDTVVELFSPGGDPLAVNDDGGPGTDSLLTATLPEDGEYEVAVGISEYGGLDGAGPYRVAWRNAALPGLLQADVRVGGEFDVDGGGWRFRGAAGQTVLVTAGSAAFDTFVELRSPAGERLGVDTNGGPGTDSRLVATLPRDGEYAVRVGFSGGVAGPYDVGVYTTVNRLEMGVPATGFRD